MSETSLLRTVPCLVVAGLSTLFPVQAAPTVDDSRARAHLIEVHSALSSASMSRAEWLALFKPRNPETPLWRFHRETDLGFGAHWLRRTVSPGTATCRVDALVVDTPGGSWVVETRICLDLGKSESASYLDLVELTGGEWTLSVDRVEGSHLYFSWEDPARQAELERKVDRELGPRPPANVPAELAEAFEHLTSPFQAGTYFGLRAGTDRGGATHAAIQRIVAARRPDLLRNILRSMNPVGRVYAAEALLQRGPLPPEDATAIQALRAMDVPIQVCRGGCEILPERAAEALDRAMARRR